jgi:DNA-directed RNA polymerase specialized sigma subunit
MADETEERIVAHLSFARAVASREIDPRCRGADREDLIAAGVVGLVHAMSKLPPLRRVSASDGGATRVRRVRADS